MNVSNKLHANNQYNSLGLRFALHSLSLNQTQDPLRLSVILKYYNLYNKNVTMTLLVREKEKRMICERILCRGGEKSFSATFSS